MVVNQNGKVKNNQAADWT